MTVWGPESYDSGPTVSGFGTHSFWIWYPHDLGFGICLILEGTPRVSEFGASHVSDGVSW